MDRSEKHSYVEKLNDSPPLEIPYCDKTYKSTSLKGKFFNENTWEQLKCDVNETSLIGRGVEITQLKKHLSDPHSTDINLNESSPSRCNVDMEYDLNADMQFGELEADGINNVHKRIRNCLGFSPPPRKQLRDRNKLCSISCTNKIDKKGMCVTGSCLNTDLINGKCEKQELHNSKCPDNNPNKKLDNDTLIYVENVDKDFSRKNVTGVTQIKVREYISYKDHIDCVKKSGTVQNLEMINDHEDNCNVLCNDSIKGNEYENSDLQFGPLKLDIDRVDITLEASTNVRTDLEQKNDPQLLINSFIPDQSDGNIIYKVVEIINRMKCEICRSKVELLISDKDAEHKLSVLLSNYFNGRSGQAFDDINECYNCLDQLEFKELKSLGMSICSFVHGKSEDCQNGSNILFTNAKSKLPFTISLNNANCHFHKEVMHNGGASVSLQNKHYQSSHTINQKVDLMKKQTTLSRHRRHHGLCSRFKNLKWSQWIKNYFNEDVDVDALNGLYNGLKCKVGNQSNNGGMKLQRSQTIPGKMYFKIKKAGLCKPTYKVQEKTHMNTNYSEEEVKVKSTLGGIPIMDNQFDHLFGRPHSSLLPNRYPASSSQGQCASIISNSFHRYRHVPCSVCSKSEISQITKGDGVHFNKNITTREHGRHYRMLKIQRIIKLRMLLANYCVQNSLYEVQIFSSSSCCLLPTLKRKLKKFLCNLEGYSKVLLKFEVVKKVSLFTARYCIYDKDIKLDPLKLEYNDLCIENSLISYESSPGDSSSEKCKVMSNYKSSSLRLQAYFPITILKPFSEYFFLLPDMSYISDKYSNKTLFIYYCSYKLRYILFLLGFLIDKYHSSKIFREKQMVAQFFRNICFFLCTITSGLQKTFLTNVYSDFNTNSFNQSSNILGYGHNKKCRRFNPGKEERDRIDGIDFLAFETEEDMMYFSALEHKSKFSSSHTYIKKKFNLKFTDVPTIIPTKTDDITKIKGWRNKSFAKCHIPGIKNSSICCNVEKNLTKVGHTFKNSTKIYYQPPVGKSGNYYEKSEFNHKQNFNSIQKAEPEQVESRKEKCDSVNKMLKDKLNTVYADKLKSDPVLQELQNGSNNSKMSPFESPILDNYLLKNSALQVSYEVPQLSASENFQFSFERNERSSFPLVKKLEPVLIQPKSEVDTLKIYKPKTLAEKRILMEMSMNEEKPILFEEIPKESDLNKKDKRFKRVSDALCKEYNPNHRYVWVQSRPIRVAGTKYDLLRKRKFSDFICESSDAPDFRRPLSLQKALSHVSQPIAFNKDADILPIKEELDESKCTTDSSSCKTIEENKVVARPHYSMITGGLKMPDNSLDEKVTNSEKCHKFQKISLIRRWCYDPERCKVSESHKLGLVMNIGLKRSFLAEELNNFEALKAPDNVIDERWANIAACAIHTKDSSYNINRVIVPVVTTELINRVNLFVSETTKDMDPLRNYDFTNFMSQMEKFDIPSQPVKPSKEVESIINNALDYVCRREELSMMQFPFDPDAPKPYTDNKLKKTKSYKDKPGTSGVERELRRLINVSIIDVDQSSDGTSEDVNCSKDFCRKGCVCISLDSKIPLSHCGKEKCIFKCICKNREFPPEGYMVYKKSSKHLAKEEKTWHQTVIRNKNNVITVMGGTDRLKREKKLPERFRNHVILGKEVFSTETRHDYSNEQPKCHSPKPKKRTRPYNTIKSLKKECAAIEDVTFNQASKKIKLLENSTTLHDDIKEEEPVSVVKEKKRIETIKRQDMIRILSFISTDPVKEEQKSLADVLIWCIAHDIYNCLCCSWVCDLKNNILLWKPTKYNKYLSHKQMACMKLNGATNEGIAQIYNTLEHSARTFGSPINYLARNKSKGFQQKRACEIENSNLSISNSYYKLSYILKDTLNNNLNNLEKIKFRQDESDNSDIVERYDIESVNTGINNTNINQLPNKVLLHEHELEHLSLALPSFRSPCRWWVIGLENNFDYLRATVHKDSTSYGMILETVRQAQSRLSTVCLPFLGRKDSLFGNQFGAYAINKLKNIICLGPYGLEEDHKIVAYKFINNATRSVPFSDIENDYGNEKIRAFWCYKKEKEKCNGRLIIARTSEEPKPQFDSDLSLVNNKSILIKKNCQLPLDCKKEISSNSQIEIVKVYESSQEKDVEVEDSVSLDGTNCTINDNSEKKQKKENIHEFATIERECAGSILESDEITANSSNIVKIPKESTDSSSPNETQKSHEYGILCLTRGIGYLPVTEYSQHRLTIQDPQELETYHIFRNLETACSWLNRYLREKMTFEPEDLVLEWIMVKPGLLERISIFDPSVLNKSHIVRKTGLCTKPKTSIVAEKHPQHKVGNPALTNCTISYKMVILPETTEKKKHISSKFITKDQLTSHINVNNNTKKTVMNEASTSFEKKLKANVSANKDKCVEMKSEQLSSRINRNLFSSNKFLKGIPIKINPELSITKINKDSPLSPPIIPGELGPAEIKVVLAKPLAKIVPPGCSIIKKRAGNIIACDIPTKKPKNKLIFGPLQKGDITVKQNFNHRLGSILKKTVSSINVKEQNLASDRKTLSERKINCLPSSVSNIANLVNPKIMNSVIHQSGDKTVTSIISDKECTTSDIVDEMNINVKSPTDVIVDRSGKIIIGKGHKKLCYSKQEVSVSQENKKTPLLMVKSPEEINFDVLPTPGLSKKRKLKKMKVSQNSDQPKTKISNTWFAG